VLLVGPLAGSTKLSRVVAAIVRPVTRHILATTMVGAGSAMAMAPTAGAVTIAAIAAIAATLVRWLWTVRQLWRLCGAYGWTGR
jgi:hypothetical protein